MQKQAQALLGILERALPPEDKIQWLLDHFPGRAIVDKQRQKVRMIVRKLVELGVYRTTDAVWNDMRDRRKSRDFSDMDFERAILSHGGYFQAVLRNLTEGHAQNVTKAIELECEKTREVIHSITAQLGRKHPR